MDLLWIVALVALYGAIWLLMVGCARLARRSRT